MSGVRWGWVITTKRGKWLTWPTPTLKEAWDQLGDVGLLPHERDRQNCRAMQVRMEAVWGARR
jgi:hypothetical protein